MEQVNANHKRVSEILKIEADAILHSAINLDSASVDLAIALLSDCSGKVIVTGVGKSGVIAEKIAQTMTSTGTIAVFVHPTDALHGGLGVVACGDVVIALSNSGETEEILAIVPTLKQRGIAMIAIVGNINSTLARQSDVFLDGSVDKEACPLNLAPTASTTVALAIGDALSMTVMELKGLTAEDFAANHPAGRLGKRLTLTVASLMRTSPSVTPDSNWLEVVRSISDHALGAVNVIDGDGRLLGIVTDGDLRRTIERTDPADFNDLTAASMMTSGPIRAEPTMLAFDALRLMQDRPSQISVLPVVDPAGICVGLLRLHDVVGSGL